MVKFPPESEYEMPSTIMSELIGEKELAAATTLAEQNNENEQLAGRHGSGGDWPAGL